MRIRDDVPRHMAELKAWLQSTETAPLEEMAAFFGARIDSYEEHMATWSEAYRRVAELVPEGARSLLDLGCGTGLELDALLARRPALAVTGVDLSSEMLAKLHAKHPAVALVQADYTACELGESRYDAALSFETLHHLTPEVKGRLFAKLYRALKPGGAYLQADYIACCDEEERLLADTLARRRARQGLPRDAYVHFDTPLTLEHELALLRGASFVSVEAVECIAGACILRACRAEDSTLDNTAGI